jgi:hypothetical protein
MPLYPLGISRCRDVPSVPVQAAGAIDMRWSLSEELACAFIDAPHHAVPPMLHAAALEAIHRRICVLPVRFGVALRDETEIRSMLQDRCQELLDHLNRLDLTCEMGLRIAPPTTPSLRRPPPETQAVASPKGTVPFSLTRKSGQSPSQSPLAYMEERRSHYRRADENAERDRSIVQQFVERLHGYYRQWRKLPSSPTCPVRLAFLVERDRVAAFRNRVESTCRTDQEGRCAILGPWPPYSFV